jgi:hypothetical protein
VPIDIAIVRIVHQHIDLAEGLDRTSTAVLAWSSSVTFPGNCRKTEIMPPGCSSPIAS